MIKGQYHEEFASFADLTFEEAAASAVKAVGNVAAKSIAVVQFERAYYVSIGYTKSEANYPVIIEQSGLDGPDDLDAQIRNQVDSREGVICHALYLDEFGALMLVLMLHDD